MSTRHKRHDRQKEMKSSCEQSEIDKRTTRNDTKTIKQHRQLKLQTGSD